MARTTYRWVPERLWHRLFPFAVTGVWWLAWLSPPGRALYAWLQASVPPLILGPLGLGLITLVVTYGTIGFFHRVDTTARPAFVARRKLQQPFSDPARPGLGECVRVLAINHGILLAGLVPFGLALWLRGWSAFAPTTWYIVLLQITAMALLTEVLFFSGHYWLHTKWLYRHVHKVHHRFRTPTVWSAQFAHPFEYIVGNILPISLPMVLIAPDVLTLWNFGLLAVLNTQLVHSGYQLSFSPWAVCHDLHHYRVTVNYGSMGLMDRLFGTRLRHPDGDRAKKAAEAAEAGRPTP